jgi:hypothetical protein
MPGRLSPTRSGMTRASIETKRRAKARRFRLTIPGADNRLAIVNAPAVRSLSRLRGRAGVGALSQDLTMIKVTKLKPLGGYRLHATFSDGTAGEHDFSALVADSGPMVEPLRDPAYFARVFLEDGAPTWPNGFDMCPNWLHRQPRRSGSLPRW